MTKLRMFMLAALAVTAALGVPGQALAQDSAGLDPHLKLVAVAKIPMTDISPDTAAPALLGGPLALGVLPPLDSSGNEYWACFTGGSDPDCSSIPAGGWVSGIPYLFWSKKTCTSKKTACAQLTWWFQNNSTDTTDDLIVTISANQGEKFILYQTFDAGSNDLYSGHLIWVTIDVGFGPGYCGTETCSKPVDGEATLQALALVGSSTATASQVIVFQ
jgi:hypothetical protein